MTMEEEAICIIRDAIMAKIARLPMTDVLSDPTACVALASAEVRAEILTAVTTALP